MSIEPPPAETAPVSQHRQELAKVPPLDVDGITAVTIGTTAFAIATVVLVLNRGWLATHGHSGWLGISVCGIILGLIGLAYSWDRRRRRRLRGS